MPVASKSYDRLHGQPKRIIFVDTETIPVKQRDGKTEVHHFRLAVASFCEWSGTQITAEKVVRYSAREQFWSDTYDFLRRDCTTWLVAHNAHFDLTQLAFWHELITRKVTTSTQSAAELAEYPTLRHRKSKWQGMVVLERTPYVVQLLHKHGRLDVVDSSNYFRSTLYEIGQQLGKPKLPMPPFDDSDESWFDYCENDVAVLQAAVTGLMREWTLDRLGQFKPTAPMLAMSCYLTRFADEKIIPHDDAEVRSIERDSYFGGAVRVWYAGDVVPLPEIVGQRDRNRKENGRSVLAGPAAVVDVRSLYPSIMANNPFPVRLHQRIGPCSLATLGRLLDHGCVIARVEVAGVAAEYPYRTEQRTLYPCGRYITTLAGPELARALKRGEIRQCIDCVTYHAGFPFRNWVAHWWKEREAALATGNAVRSDFCKLLLNALPGKFGQRVAGWITTDEIAAPLPWGHWIDAGDTEGSDTEYRSVGWTVQRRATPGEHPKAFPAVSSYVTSYGRVRMKELYDKCPAKSIMYQDTDSFICFPEAVHALRDCGELHHGELGKPRIQYLLDRVSIYGPKNYTADGREVVAGLKPGSHHVHGRTWLIPHWDGVGTLMSNAPSATTLVSWDHVTMAGGCPGYRVDPHGWVHSQSLEID